MVYSPFLEIETGSNIQALTFTTSSKYLVTGGEEKVQLRQVRDGVQLPTAISATKISCLAVSNDGRWIAGGTLSGEVFVWDAETCEQVLLHKDDDKDINGVDFSPGSAQRRVVVASDNRTAAVWDVVTRTRVLGPLLHDHWVTAAKYSPQGNRIATGTVKSVRIYDSDYGHLLIQALVGVTPHYNTGLLWSGDYWLLVLSDNKIKRIEPSTCSVVSEWPVSNGNELSCVVQPDHRGFVAYSTDRTITFWETVPHVGTRLGLIQHTEDIDLLALSPDSRFLAIASGQKLAIYNLLHFFASVFFLSDSIPLSCLHPTFQEPDIHINEQALDLWKHDRLANVETLLSETIMESSSINHHVLATRALVRTRLQAWDAAISDAEQSLKIQPSIIGYVAKSVAHVCKGEGEQGYRSYDIAFELFHSDHAGFLLLLKAIVIFMAREYNDAILRMDDLIATVPLNSVYYVVQAYMYFLLGNSHAGVGNYEDAIQSFEHARIKLQYYGGRPLVVISLITGWRFDDLKIMIQQRLCEVLYTMGRIKEGLMEFLEMFNDPNKEDCMSRPVIEWAADFKSRVCEELEHLGDEAMDAHRHEVAIAHYSAALSIHPDFSQRLFVKRSKARMAVELWNDAVNDADEAIAQDPSSPWGYEVKCAALHGGKRYVDAVDAYETMLSKMAQSRDPKVRDRRSQFISPLSMRAKTRKIVQRTVRHLPHVLINTSTGRLHSKAEQASAFESSLIFHELLSSMTTSVDWARIKHEVRRFFRYVMLSHKWEENEPLFQQVVHVSLYDLDKSPTHDKLQTFCKTTRDAGFNWAWSDTCCIDKQDHFVHQESLVTMFKWYRNAVMVIVYLRGVRSPGSPGDLVKSIWNTRSWTFQEYVAGRVVRFYTEDWDLYLGLDASNHKEAPGIITEMEKVTGVPAKRLMALRPGLSNIREKLCLASTRQSTLMEDAAYSLFGIFSVTGMPVIYGERENALGRLLAHVLSCSGDASILAWTGQSSSVNSCLPARITVYSRLATSHLPRCIDGAEMADIVTALRSSLDVGLAIRLYDRLNGLPIPWFAANRMKLPCLAFQVPPFSPYESHSYRSETLVFGTVEIKTRRDLSHLKSLYLIHPWLDAILGRDDTQSSALTQGGSDVAEPSSPSSDGEDTNDELEVEEDILSARPESDPPSFTGPTLMDTVPLDRETRALQLIARLRRPFGALLVALISTNGREEYMRVVTDSLITVKIRPSVSLDELLENVRTLDIL